MARGFIQTTRGGMAGRGRGLKHFSCSGILSRGPRGPSLATQHELQTLASIGGGRGPLSVGHKRTPLFPHLPQSKAHENESTRPPGARRLSHLSPHPPPLRSKSETCGAAEKSPHPAESPRRHLFRLNQALLGAQGLR